MRVHRKVPRCIFLVFQRKAVYQTNPNAVFRSKTGFHGAMLVNLAPKNNVLPRLGMSSKEVLDNAECIQLVRLCSDVHLQCRTCIAIVDTKVSWTPSFGISDSTVRSLKKLNALLDSGIVDSLKQLYGLAPDYDFRELRANGIRSFLLLTTRCLASLLTYLRSLNTYSVSTWSGKTERLVCAYIDCFKELHTCINLLCTIPRFCDHGTLFPRSVFTGLPEVGQCDMGPLSSAQVHLEVTDENDQSPSSQARNQEDPELARELMYFKNLQTRFDRIKQEYFYGRCLGFYFCPSAQRILLLLGSFMAGYGNTFNESKQGLSNFVFTIYRSVSSFLSPEERGVLIARLTRSSNVNFCKALWSFAEHPLITGGPNVILPAMSIVHSFELMPRKLRVPFRPEHIPTPLNGNETMKRPQRFVTINYPVAHFGPEPVSVRLLSYRSRPGMEWAQQHLLTSILQSTNLASKPNDLDIPDSQVSDQSPRRSSSSQALGATRTSVPPQSDGLTHPPEPESSTDSSSSSSSSNLSPYLLFHIHGGGFVALKSQSQDIFLRQWAEFLDCPIFSVDYSLAPKAPYPRALEECYFAYCWASLNRTRLGAQPNARIVLCGDSAGGNLVLGLCLRLAYTGIHPLPHGALVAYAPVLVSFTPSPARMLSLMDPLLPIGILSKCLLAYAGVDEKRLNPDPTGPPHDAVDTTSQRTRSSFSGYLWNRFVPRLWSGSPATPDENLQSTSVEQSGGRRFHNRPRDRFSVPVGLSEMCTPIGNGSTPCAQKNDSSVPSNDPSESRSTPRFTLPNSENESSCRAASLGVSLPTQSRLSPSFSLRDDQVMHMKRELPSDLDRVRYISFSQDSFMSPYLASDDLLRQLPPLGIVCSNFDPFLDDCLELAKRASRLGVSVDMRVVDDLPHAFLNFAPLGPEFQYANKVCMNMLKSLFERDPENPCDPSSSSESSSPAGMSKYHSFDEDFVAE
ncbi:Hormone-sensitive lipase [Clonorchis sinensis]|uniref:Hormone-sensitive lipase n=3 Tax=Clonorchis sinensis TaxID=79923 RepID=A0A8T1MB85_CLOSI|nr:Hormone-sensitive lipase [Clonorchis sinensis]